MYENDFSVVSLKRLAYFIALARHGSISAAANALNMAQPSLSENITKLEKQLDIKLAVRSPRGIQLTEAGSLLADRGSEVLNIMDKLIDELHVLTGQPRGPVTLGITPSLSILLALPLIETIHVEFPDIKLSVAEAMSSDIVEWVESERVDLGCVYETIDHPNLTFEPLFTEELFLVTAPDNWDGEIGPDGIALEPVTPEQLSELPLVLTSPMHGARKLHDRFAQSIGISLNVIAAIDSHPYIVEMVSRASAYSILAQGSVLHQVAQGKLALVPLPAPGLRRQAYIIRKRTRPVSRVGTVIEENIRLITKEVVERFGMQSMRPE